MNHLTNIGIMNARKYIFILIATIFAHILPAQNAKQATQWFDKAEFEKAKPAFKKLVKAAPNNAGYNFYYGACCYETGDLKEALPYLKKSAQRKYINAYRYLGKLYADMYRYDEAIENYETHLEWLEEKKRNPEVAEEELAFIRKCFRMMKGVEKIMVVDSFVVDKKNFLDAYKISKEAGKLSTIPNSEGIMFTNEMGNKMLYGDISGNGEMHLYTSYKLIDSWEEATPILSINEMGNVNYPFLMGDGVTLYFASDGEGSLGGYDIFVTRYDSEDNTYLKATNMGMPFNSTANDYMLVIDETNNLGWFASDRYQPEGKVCVYVFIPNETKETYNYENTDQQIIINAATLRAIRNTWTNPNLVKEAQQRLADALQGKAYQQDEKDFTFIINDAFTYHHLKDFRSPEAAKAFQKLMVKERELNNIQSSLHLKREQYAIETEAGKQKLAPSILDLEKRIPLMKDEVENLANEVRKLEIQKRKK